MHRGCLPNGGARGEDFARNEIPHPCCVLYLSAKVWFLSEIAIDPDMVDDDCYRVATRLDDYANNCVKDNGLSKIFKDCFLCLLDVILYSLVEGEIYPQTCRF